MTLTEVASIVYAKLPERVEPFRFSDFDRAVREAETEEAIEDLIWKAQQENML